MAETQIETAARLNKLADDVSKIGGETSGLVALVQELKDALANANVTDPAVLDATARLETSIKTVDDMVPDAPAPEPTV